MSIVAQTATLAHGFTMADVDRAARMAAHKAYGALSYQERFEVAWMAIVEALYDSADTPDLVKIGCRAIGTESNDHLRHHGLRPTRGEDFTPNFRVFWLHVGNGQDFTDSIAERLALPQVLSQLTPAEYEAIAALAAHGTSTAAARSLGLKRGTFSARIMSARRRIEALWFAPETPRDTRQRKLTLDGQCNYGHDMSEHGYVNAANRIRCRRCLRNAARRASARGGKGENGP